MNTNRDYSNDPMQEKEMSELDRVLASINGRLGTLHDVISALEQRLKPIMIPESPVNEDELGKMDCRPLRSPVVSTLTDYNSTLSYYRDRIEVLLSRIEI